MFSKHKHIHIYIYICKSFLCNCTEKLGFDTNAFYINVSEFSSIISIACTNVEF